MKYLNANIKGKKTPTWTDLHVFFSLFLIIIFKIFFKKLIKKGKLDTLIIYQTNKTKLATTEFK